ncbi:MAG: class I SAM-dependent methyltransferase [Anaerolineae bacterium]
MNQRIARTHSSHSACPNCASHDNQLHVQKRVNERSYDIVQCRRCGLLHLLDMPTADELTAFYNSPDYFEGSDRGYTGNYLRQRASIEHDSLRRLSQIEREVSRLAVDPERRILDIGCAAGSFLSVAQPRGWSVHGIELSHEMASHARQLLGVDIQDTFDPNAFAAGSFTAITLWEVIEHLTDPLTTLRHVYGWLRPGGMLALSTPNTGHWHAQRKPEWWSEFKPPAHVIYFVETTLRDMLARAGFAQVAFVRTRRLAISPRTLMQLRQLRHIIGDGADRRTPLWPLTSLTYRAASAVAGALRRLRYPADDLYVGLEAYALKPM